ncbi:MAG TPA: CHRD domain-containing protein [Bellilinea sp.]|nr:CHRD domain-containing protein [Bellilinea sp.]
MKGFTQFKLLSGLTLIMLIFTLATASSVQAAVVDGETGGRPFFVEMTGAAEAPGPGDPDGTGTAFFTLNQGLGEICFELTVANIDPAAAAHIHRADVGVPGPIVVPLVAPTSGMSSGCAVVDPVLIMEIRQFPERFYVNVHNPAFPAGAVRGQLSK